MANFLVRVTGGKFNTADYTVGVQASTPVEARKAALDQTLAPEADRKLYHAAIVTPDEAKAPRHVTKH